MEQIKNIVKPTAVKPMSAAATQRAKETDVQGTGHRCLIENCSSLKAINLVHALERETTVSDQLASKLEWAWNMRKNTLNLDTRRNILFVGASLRVLYQQKRWCLLPVESVVDKYLDETGKVALPRGQFPDLDDESYEYRFCPLQRMEEVYLTREANPEGGHDSMRKVYVHRYPFNCFPIITSAVDPKYVIAQLGSIITSFDDDKLKKVSNKYALLNKIVTLYKAWTKELPEDAEKDESYVQPIEDGEFSDIDYLDALEASSEGDSIRTPRRRIPTRSEDGKKKEFVISRPSSPSPATRLAYDAKCDAVERANIVGITLSHAELEAIAAAAVKPVVEANPSATNATKEASQTPATPVKGAKNSKKRAASTSTTAKPVANKKKTAIAKPVAQKATEEPSKPAAKPVRVTRTSKKRATEEDPAVGANGKPAANKRRKVNPVEVADPTTGDAAGGRFLRRRSAATKAKAKAPAPSAQVTRTAAPNKATVGKKTTRPRWK